MTTHELSEYVASLVRQRLSYQEIGKLLGISRQRAHQIYKARITKPFLKVVKVNIHYPPPTATPEELAAIAQTQNSISVPTDRSISGITGIKTGTRDRVRELVRIRDGHTCQICHKQWIKGMRRFDVHHLDPEMEGKQGSQRSIHTLYDRANLDKMITLCHKCHIGLDHIRNKMREKNLARLEKLSTAPS